MWLRGISSENMFQVAWRIFGRFLCAKKHIMKTLLPVFALSLMLTAKAQEHPVEIRFMKNIEFFGYLIELGDPSDNDPNHPISKYIHQYPERGLQVRAWAKSQAVFTGKLGILLFKMTLQMPGVS